MFVCSNFNLVTSRHLWIVSLTQSKLFPWRFHEHQKRTNLRIITETYHIVDPNPKREKSIITRPLRADRLWGEEFLELGNLIYNRPDRNGIKNQINWSAEGPHRTVGL